MQLDVRSLGLAAAGMAALLRTLCSLLTVVAPGSARSITATLLHLDSTALPALTVTWGGFVASLVGWTLLVGLSVAGVGSVYNRLAR